MESPRKFNDCYFYYYSTCTKGDNCVFRHEPSALGCETMCTAWQQGKCLDKRCKLRHMELRKNRKQIPCYWENQPGGCRKKHCPFMHKNPDARTDGIAPSQPAPPQPAGAALAGCAAGGVGGVGGVAGAGEGGAELAVAPVPPAPAPAPAPVPLLWQQQRQVLDSAILGVLPASSELLGARRVLPPHAHPHAHAHAHAHAHDAPNPYAPHAAHAPLPVDPLVVNFEEESDTESAPSSTPTKLSEEARAKSQELLLLERIQAEAAALYGYDALPEPPERRPRASLPNYDRLSLDEIAGKKHQPAAERRTSLDFKVLSLDEIRARKKSDAIIHPTPITLNLSRKRKLSTTETITTSGNKIIKVVRSNSIVYKKVDHNAPVVSSQSKTDQKPAEENVSRKRTLSELSDLYDIHDDELEDNVYEFKRIKVAEQTTKPRLIRNRSLNNKDNMDIEHSKDEEVRVSDKVDDDSDSEVQIVSVGVSDKNTDVSAILDTEIIDVDSAKMGDPVAIVDLSDDDSDDVIVSDLDLGLVKNVPDVVASCHKNTNLIENTGKDLLNSIDAILNDEL